MKLFTEEEVTHILDQGRMLSEQDGTTLLDEFEMNQPEIYQAIYGILSDEIAEVNIDMSNLFLDACFDIIWFHRMTIGSPPVAKEGDDWVNKSLSLLDAEMKSFIDDAQMDSDFKDKLQKRFLERCIETGIQPEFIKKLDSRVKNYASNNKERSTAITITSNFLFIILRLIDELYSRETH